MKRMLGRSLAAAITATIQKVSTRIKVFIRWVSGIETERFEERGLEENTDVDDYKHEQKTCKDES